MKTDMNKTKKVFALLFCMIFAFATICPIAFASADDFDVKGSPAYEREKLKEFFNQTNEDGVTNGELMCAEMTPWFGFEQIDYDPSSVYALNSLLDTPYFGYRGISERLSLSLYAQVDIEKPRALLNPRLCGTLDLSGTDIGLLEDYYGGNCNISSIYLNDCNNLTGIAYSSPGLVELHALNSGFKSGLKGVDIKSDSLRVLEIRLKPADTPIIMNVLGSGHFNFNYNSVGRGTKLTLTGSEQPFYWESNDALMYSATAYPNDGAKFLGWYSGGELVSDAAKYYDVATNGANVTAVFAGDANGDGVVDMSDALSIMRSGMGLDAQGEIGMCDIDGDTQITTSDSLVLMRFVLGLD